MSEQKGLGSKLKRLFIEEGEAGSDAASAADEVARLAAEVAPGAPAGAVLAAAPGDASAAATAAPSRASAGSSSAEPVEPAKVDFGSIYKTAGIADDDLGQVERTEQLLRTLPASLPLETQKQVLEATLKTFGVDPQKIRACLARQQHALASYAQVVKQDADKRDAEARAKVESLRAEALKLEHAIEERSRSRAGVELACANKSEAVARVAQYLPAAAGPTGGK